MCPTSQDVSVEPNSDRALLKSKGHCLIKTSKPDWNCRNWVWLFDIVSQLHASTYMATSGSHTENLAAVSLQDLRWGQKEIQLLLSIYWAHGTNYMEIGNTWQYSGNMCRKHQEATCCTCCPMISRLKLFRTVQLKSKYSWASESFLARRKSLAKDVRKISGVSNSAIISLCKILLFRKNGEK